MFFYFWYLINSVFIFIQGPVWKIVVNKKCKTACYYASILASISKGKRVVIENPVICVFFIRSWKKPKTIGPARNYPELHRAMIEDLALDPHFAAKRMGWAPCSKDLRAATLSE